MDGSSSSSAACLGKCLLSALLLSATSTAFAQGRQSLELGVLGQTTSNKITAPYHVVYGPSSLSILGTHNEQVFAGPLLDYTYGFNRSFSFDGRASYLFGKQPVVHGSGGNALLLSAGIRATFGPRPVQFYLRLEPGLVRFDQAGTSFSSTGYYNTGAATHFTLDEGAGVEVHLAPTTALRFELSQILYVQGQSHGTFGDLTYSFPAEVEDHLTFALGLAHYFGQPFPSPAPTSSHPPSFRNEVVLSFASQTQLHLAFGAATLSSDSGVGLSGSHNFSRYIGVDASAIVLPGGAAPNYQDGGTETELLAGPRFGLQHPHYGIFAKVRAGAVTFSFTINQDVVSPPPVRSWDFAFEGGGIFECYPRAGHLVLRLDVSQQYTLYHSVTVTEPPPEPTATQGGTYTSSPVILLGAGWRF